MEKGSFAAQTQSRQPGIEADMVLHPDCSPRFAGSGRLSGRTAFISGGGIGRATAVLFAREGANVAIHYKDERRDAADTLALVEQEGAQTLTLFGDLGWREEATRAVRGHGAIRSRSGAG